MLTKEPNRWKLMMLRSNYQQLRLLGIRRRICWKQKVQEATKVLFVESIFQFVLWKNIYQKIPIARSCYEKLFFTNNLTSCDWLYRHIIQRHGPPRAIVSDREPNFTAKLFRSFCREFNIELRLTTSYNPASNGEQLIDKTERLFLLLRLSRRSMLRISSVHSLINIRITVLHST